MNKLTLELAKQAGLKFPSEVGLSPPEIKFAELIVRECVQSIEKTIQTNCDTDSEKMGCEFAITDLLEHFGVEE